MLLLEKKLDQIGKRNKNLLTGGTRLILSGKGWLVRDLVAVLGLVAKSQVESLEFEGVHFSTRVVAALCRLLRDPINKIHTLYSTAVRGLTTPLMCEGCHGSWCIW